MNTAEDKAFAVLRIIFGGVWFVDAVLKWSPAFLNNLAGYLIDGAQGQPALVQAWINLWIKIVNVDPYLFAVAVAVLETAVALGLLFGLFTEIAIAGGIAMTLVIWTTAEGFGGPYVAGSADIGAGIIYVVVFIALWLGRCWRYYGFDPYLKNRFPRLYWRW